MNRVVVAEQPGNKIQSVTIGRCLSDPASKLLECEVLGRELGDTPHERENFRVHAKPGQCIHRLGERDEQFRLVRGVAIVAIWCVQWHAPLVLGRKSGDCVIQARVCLKREWFGCGEHFHQERQAWLVPRPQPSRKAAEGSLRVFGNEVTQCRSRFCSAGCVPVISRYTAGRAVVGTEPELGLFRVVSFGFDKPGALTHNL